MTLGMISWIHEEDFQRVKAKGLSFVELDVNDRVKEFLDALEQTKEYSKKYDLPVAAIGSRAWHWHLYHRLQLCRQPFLL